MQTQITPEVQQSTPQGTVDVDQIISEIKMPPNLKDIYEKAVISGMRVMFDNSSHHLLLDILKNPGKGLDDKISQGVITLAAILWEKSNHTLPPPIIVPLTVTLTLRAFEFLQQSGEPGADKETLGNALDKSTHGVLLRFGVSADQVKQFVRQNQRAAQDAGMGQEARENPVNSNQEVM